VCKVIWQEAALPCYLSWRLTHLSAEHAGQAYGRCSEFFQLVSTFSHKNAPSHGRIWTHIKYMVPWIRVIQQPKQHFDSFSCVFHSSPVCPPHTKTDRHIDHTTCNICSNKPHLWTVWKQCSLKILQHVFWLYHICVTDQCWLVG